ncbi:hypothetical protein [Shewanella sp. GXUN23E]|uniref:hypothetical protein n=1 Tax=Shewanella sp. GXUN23E TaxID=3422498 RepID=UPI003D7E78AA
MTAGILLLGFFVGMSHALEADHLAAIATLACKNHSVGAMAKQGIAWGIGHSITLFVFAGFALILGTVIPQNYASMLEMLVGGMLIVLGLDVARQLQVSHSHRARGKIHCRQTGLQAQSDVNAVTAEAETGTADTCHALLHHPSSNQASAPESTTRALGIGLMHGTAGSAALIILAMGETQGLVPGLLYILLFGIGSIVGMALLSMTLMWPMLKIQHHDLTRWYRLTQYLVALVSCVLGVTVVFRAWFTIAGAVAS